MQCSQDEPNNIIAEKPLSKRLVAYARESHPEACRIFLDMKKLAKSDECKLTSFLSQWVLTENQIQNILPLKQNAAGVSSLKCDIVNMILTFIDGHFEHHLDGTYFEKIFKLFTIKNANIETLTAKYSSETLTKFFDAEFSEFHISEENIQQLSKKIKSKLNQLEISLSFSSKKVSNCTILIPHNYFTIEDYLKSINMNLSDKIVSKNKEKFLQALGDSKNKYAALLGFYEKLFKYYLFIYTSLDDKSMIITQTKSIKKIKSIIVDKIMKDYKIGDQDPMRVVDAFIEEQLVNVDSRFHHYYTQLTEKFLPKTIFHAISQENNLNLKSILYFHKSFLEDIFIKSFQERDKQVYKYFKTTIVRKIPLLKDVVSYQDATGILSDSRIQCHDDFSLYLQNEKKHDSVKKKEHKLKRFLRGSLRNKSSGQSTTYNGDDSSTEVQEQEVLYSLASKAFGDIFDYEPDLCTQKKILSIITQATEPYREKEEGKFFDERNSVLYIHPDLLNLLKHPKIISAINTAFINYNVPPCASHNASDNLKAKCIEIFNGESKSASTTSTSSSSLVMSLELPSVSYSDESSGASSPPIRRTLKKNRTISNPRLALSIKPIQQTVVEEPPKRKSFTHDLGMFKPISPRNMTPRPGTPPLSGGSEDIIPDQLLSELSMSPIFTRKS